MSSGHDRPSAKRYDCFISFPGSQALSDLGFEGDGLDCTVRQLASKVYDCLHGFSPRPSVFFDEREIGGHWPDYLSHAILQLRGGGIALVLLTAEYLASKYCLAELRAFLDIERLRSVAGREGEAIDVRVVVLEQNKRAVPEALQDVALKDFIGADLGRMQCTSIPVEKRSTRGLVVEAICEHVFKIWNPNSNNKNICLGSNINDCVDDLADSFPESDCPRIVRKLRFRLEDFPQGMSVSSIFCKALEKGKFSNSFYLAELSNSNFNVAAKNALAAFRRKWCSDSWEWGLDPKENGICLTRFISDADDALRRRHRPAKHGISPLRHQIAQLGVRKERSEGFSENGGYKVKRVQREKGSQWEKGGASADTGGGIFERTDDLSDCFRPFFPKQSQLDLNLVPDAATSLAQLRAAVISVDQSGNGPTDAGHSGKGVGGLGLRRVAITSVNGEGGVGKTSACKLLCANEAVRDYFDEGAILWIDVGQDANEEKVVGELRKAVSRCGGKLAAKEIQRLDSVSEAVDCACEFFSGRRLLIIVDNVWETPAGSRVKSWADTLSKITECPGSAIVMTTRFTSLALSPGCNRVELGCLNLKIEGSADWHIAENIYDAFVNETEKKKACDGYKNSRRKALRLSCGLPLGITTFAGLVRRYSKMGGDAEDVLALIEKKVLGLASKSVGEAQKPTTGHDGLHAAMEESLGYLDRREGNAIHTQLAPRLGCDDTIMSDSLVFRASYEAFPDNFFSARYAALKAMPASTLRLSLDVLCRLWHVPTSPEIWLIVDYFVNIGLGRIEGGGDSGLEKVFALHDLQYEFCAGLHPSSQEPVDGHALLLSSFDSLMVSKYHKPGAAAWAHFCFEDLQPSDAALRDYMSNNLIRHLCSVVPAEGSSGFGEGVSHVAISKQGILALLFNFCWLRGRLYALGGRNAALRDFASALESGFLGQSDIDSIRILMKIVTQASGGGLSHSDGTLASSLVQLAQSVEAESSASDTAFFKQLSKEADEEVLGAWLKPISGCGLSFEDGILKATTMNSSAVRFVSPLGDGKHFVAFSADGMVRVYDFLYMRDQLVLESIRGIRFIAVVQQGYASASPIIVSADTDGEVRCSRISFNGTGRVLETSCVFVGQSIFRPSFLFAAKDGKFVAVGCETGSVWVWEQGGGHSGSYELKVWFACTPDDGREYKVDCLVLSGSGEIVAACTANADLYIWRAENGIAEKVQHGQEDDFDNVLTMFLSSDEKSVIVFGCGTAYSVWDINTGERRSSDIELPAFQWLKCASLAGSSGAWEFGRSLLVGGGQLECAYCVVEHLIGDKLKVVRRCRRLSAKPVSVCSAEISHETGLSRVIVGCADGSVSVLDTDAFDVSQKLEHGQYYKQAKIAHRQTATPESRVSAVAVMPNAGLVVAGHWGGRLSLWSAEDGSFQRNIESENRVGVVSCIDISGEESVIVTGHWYGIALIWDVSTWKVRFALKYDSLTSENIDFVALSANGNRVFTHCSVDGKDELRVWDAEKVGAPLSAIDTRLFYRNLGNNVHLFVSSDGGHFLWATGPSAYLEEGKEPWQAKVFDTSGDACVLFESGKHSVWEALCAEVDSNLSLSESTASWKQAVKEHSFCRMLRDFKGKSAKVWEMTAVSEQRVQCASRSTGGQLSDKTFIRFDGRVYSIAVQWLPYFREDGRRRAVVACADRENGIPAIIHFTTPKV